MVAGQRGAGHNSCATERIKAAMPAPVSKVVLSSFCGLPPRSVEAMQYWAMRSKEAGVIRDRLAHCSVMASRGGGPGRIRLLLKASSGKMPEPGPALEMCAT